MWDSPNSVNADRAVNEYHQLLLWLGTFHNVENPGIWIMFVIWLLAGAALAFKAAEMRRLIKLVPGSSRVLVGIFFIIGAVVLLVGFGAVLLGAKDLEWGVGVGLVTGIIGVLFVGLQVVGAMFIFISLEDRIERADPHE